jgi:hypothetical protein
VLARPRPEGSCFPPDLSTYCEAEVSREDFEELVGRLCDGPRIHAPKATKWLAREETRQRTPKLVAGLLAKGPQQLSTRDDRYLRALEESTWKPQTPTAWYGASWRWSRSEDPRIWKAGSWRR